MLRLVLSLATLVVFALAIWGAYRGWQHRGERQGVVTGDFPELPDDPGPVLLGPTTGLYVGSTIAGDWQDRVAVGDVGFRAAGALTLHADGVQVARDGASSLWVPRTALLGVRTDRKLAGKVTVTGGLLVFRWSVGGATVDTGFRGDGRDDYPAWLAALPSTETVDDTENVIDTENEEPHA